MQKKERRRSRRIKKTLYVQCRLYDTTAPWDSGIVQDMSEAGMRISIMRKFAIGEILDIKISSFLRPQPINVLGKVIHREEEKTKETSWVTGISFMDKSFTDINERDKSILQKLIQIFKK